MPLSETTRLSTGGTESTVGRRCDPVQGCDVAISDQQGFRRPPGWLLQEEALRMLKREGALICSGKAGK